ncbi:MAG: aminopeptidase P family protein [Nitrospinaceae bacterium]|nr:aminopeptidase P family protein [Nitrospinaceae bacterium]
MSKEGLSAIIVYGCDGHTRDVPCRYMTNMPIIAGCRDILIFPADGEPVLLVTYPTQTFFAKRISWISEENVHGSTDIVNDLKKHLESRNLMTERVGIEAPGLWPAQDYLAFLEACPKVQLVDTSKWMSKIRAQKSDEELKLMREAVDIGELALEAFIDNLRPGMTEEKAVAPVEEILRANGVEKRLWLMSSTPEMASPWLPGETIIRKPNPILVSLEFQRSRGYTCQVVRNYCWEEPTGDYKKMFDLWKELRILPSEELRPGRNINSLGQRIKELVRDWGFECSMLGHGLGMDFFEEPAINSGPLEEEWLVMTNQVFVFHPQVRPLGGGGPFVFVGDMYLVGEESTEWMTNFMPGLPEMISGSS